MKIVCLDARALNPGDLSWDELQKLGPCMFFDRTPEVQVIERLEGAEAVLTNKVPFNRELINALPALKYIGVTATGYNIIDLKAANEKGVTVTNVPAYSTPSVAQSVFALLLELTNHTGHYAQISRDGTWSQSPDFCYLDKPTVELAGLTMGIVGFGDIGRAVSTLAMAFGMKVLVSVRTPRDLPVGIEAVDIDELFARSDVVSLHCPLTPETERLVNAERLALMKARAFLINTSRGPLVDDAALAEALNEGKISGAGLDVLTVEPPSGGNPLLAARNCVVTPHIAWATKAARQRLLNVAVENLRAYQNGISLNVVNRP
jgi:glycerate dehydrogenase